MLGMINHAIGQMVVERLGEDAWDRVRERVGFDEPVFVVMKQYPDDLTYGLVGAVAEEASLPVTKVLHDFGRYWISYSDRQPWGKVMRSMGTDLRALLRALDAMHTRIAISFPDVTMPHFRVDERPGAMLVHYFSPRAGLAPLVHGALEALGDLYGEPVEVVHAEDRAAGAQHDVFLVTFRSPAP